MIRDQRILWFLLILSTSVIGQSNNKGTNPSDSITPVTLKEVVLNSDNFNSRTKDYAGGLSIISKKELSIQNSIDLAPVLNQIPGVFMQNGTLNTNRVTMRGIGSRTLFGTSKIRSYLGEIPLTNGSGETNLDDLELENLAKLEVIKGPSSSVYGAGLGGVLHWQLNPVLQNQTNATMHFSLGSYNLQKLGVGANFGGQNNALQLQWAQTINSGYRDNNSLNKQVLNLASQHQLNTKNQLDVLAHLVKFKAFIPSSLSYTDYINSPKKAAYTWGQSKANEDYQKGLLGLTWTHDFNLNSSLHTSAFSSIFDADEDRPFNILEEKTNGLGLRTKWKNSNQFANKPLKWLIGFETFLDQKSYQTFENLYKNFPSGTGSVKGDQISDLDEKRNYLNLFFDSKWHFDQNWQLQLGVNYNYTKYKLQDNFNSGLLDQSGEYDFGHIISPKIGFTFNPNQRTMAYASISHGFSPPTLEETLLPSGLINPKIKPESGWNFEIGSRGRFKNLPLDYNIALYHMPVNNQLVARRIGDDQYMGVNAGATNFTGLELALNINWIDTTNWTFSQGINGSFNHFKFKEFEDFNQNYKDNQVTGTPENIWQSTLQLAHTAGFFAHIQYQFVDQIPITDSNDVFSDAYQLIHTKIGYSKLLFKAIKFEINAGINNVFNEKYASMLQINASSFGGNAPRYYYPGLPTNYYFSTHFSYQF